MTKLRLESAEVSAAEAGKFQSFLNIPRYFQGRSVGSVSARAFLRHAAQQWQIFNEMLARGEDPTALIEYGQSDASPEESAGELPSIFVTEDANFVKAAAAGLAEPAHAMVNTPFAVAAQNVAPVVPSIFDGPSTPFAIAPPPPAQPVAPPPAPQHQPQGPGALEHLREMMDRLRAQSPSTPPTSLMTPRVQATERLVAVTDPAATLLSRFNSLRSELTSEAEHRPLDLVRLSELIRLAGKRFPLVKYDEIDLVGLPGKTLPRWSLSDQEIIFIPYEFTDRNAWQAVVRLMAGRVASNAPLLPIKLVALKSDRETLAWTSLLGSDVIPSGMRPHLEALHLDNRSIASLYAMQRVITEAGTGALQASPAQVMSVLARELDFFWKRVTRPLNAA